MTGRTLLIRCVAVLCVAAAGSARGPSVEFRADWIPSEIVQCFTGATPQFDALLAAHTTPETRAAAEEARQWFVYVRNMSDQPIVAVMIRYDLTRTDGRVVSWHLLQENLMGQSAASLEPGSGYFVTPSGAFDRLLMMRSSAVDPGAVDDLKRKTRELAGYQLATISLDSVLLADGRFWGGDRSRTFDLIAEWRRAEADILDEVETAALSSLPDSDLAEVLRGKRAAGRPSGADKPDAYAQRKARLAQWFLQTLEAGGRPALRDLVLDFRRRPPPPPVKVH